MYAPIYTHIVQLGSFPHVSPLKTCMHHSLSSRTCYMPCQSHLSLSVPGNISWGKQMMKLLTTHSLPVLCYVVPLRPKFLPQHPVLRLPQPMYLRVRKVRSSNAPRIWWDFGSALPFQTRLTQTKPVLPLPNEHGSQVKDQGRRQCCHTKHITFRCRPTHDISLLSGHGDERLNFTLA
jgi:hypothetical protein